MDESRRQPSLRSTYLHLIPNMFGVAGSSRTLLASAHSTHSAHSPQRRLTTPAPPTTRQPQLHPPPPPPAGPTHGNPPHSDLDKLIYLASVLQKYPQFKATLARLSAVDSAQVQRLHAAAVAIETKPMPEALASMGGLTAENVNQVVGIVNSFNHLALNTTPSPLNPSSPSPPSQLPNSTHPNFHAQPQPDRGGICSNKVCQAWSAGMWLRDGDSMKCVELTPSLFDKCMDLVKQSNSPPQTTNR